MKVEIISANPEEQQGKLVFVESENMNEIPFTTSDIIAKYESDFEDFGVLAFKMRKPEKGSKGGRPELTYLLNEGQATSCKGGIINEC